MKKPNQPPRDDIDLDAIDPNDYRQDDLMTMLISVRTLLTASLARLETKIAAIQPRTPKRKHP